MSAIRPGLRTRYPRWTGALLSGVSAVLFFGCDATPGSRRGTSATDSPLVLRPSDVRVVGSSEAIATVLDLEVLGNGQVWVLNSIDPLFVAFGAAGGSAHAHGRSGGGPDEFGRAAGLVDRGIDGEAWAFDRQRHVLVEVSTAGDPRRELPIPADRIPPGSIEVGMNLLSSVVRTARMGSEVILPRRSSPVGEDVLAFWLASWSADLVAWNPESGEVREIVRLREVLGDPRAHLEQGDGLPPFPLWFRLWAVCSDDELRVYDRLENRIRAFTAEGVELEPTLLPPVRHERVTPREFARTAFDLIVVEGMGAVPANAAFEMSAADSARIIDQAVQRVTASPEQLASVLPRYVDFRCAPDGTQWLRPLDLQTGGLAGGAVWLRIGSDGAMREVRLPERFDPFRFTGDRIWGIQRDELDVASVAWLPAPADP